MALDFTPAGQSVTHGNSTEVNGTGVLSGCAWVYNDTNSNTVGAIMSKYQSGGPETDPFSLQRSCVSLLIIMDDGFGANNASAPAVFSTGAWQHVGFIYNGSEGASSRVRLLLNGSTLTLGIIGTIPVTLQASVTSLTIGDQTWDGKIALVKMWKAALTPSEIAAEQWSYWPSRTQDLFLFAPYDDGTAAVDYSGHGYNGTVTGATYADGPYLNVGAPIIG